MPSRYLGELDLRCGDLVNEQLQLADQLMTETNTQQRPLPNVGLMLGRRRRRRANINPTLGKGHVIAGWLKVETASETLTHLQASV